MLMFAVTPPEQQQQQNWNAIRMYPTPKSKMYSITVRSWENRMNGENSFMRFVRWQTRAQ